MTDKAGITHQKYLTLVPYILMEANWKASAFWVEHNTFSYYCQ